MYCVHKVYWYQICIQVKNANSGSIYWRSNSKRAGHLHFRESDEETTSVSLANLICPQQRRIQDFPDGIGDTSHRGGNQPIIWLNFAEKCLKMKKNGPRRRECTSRILQRRSATAQYSKNSLIIDWPLPLRNPGSDTENCKL